MDANQIITIPGLEENEIAALTPLQESIHPYVPEMIFFWWSLWTAVFAYVVIKHLVLPLVRKY